MLGERDFAETHSYGGSLVAGYAAYCVREIAVFSASVQQVDAGR